MASRSSARLTRILAFGCDQAECSRPVRLARDHVRLIPGHDLRYGIDSRARGFHSGIWKTVRWYLDNEWWWRPLREKVYAGERLGVLSEGTQHEADNKVGASAPASIGG